jgi:flavin reductase (DIM6/NTAB) family NADH-FMN oxidoreductase RutF
LSSSAAISERLGFAPADETNMTAIAKLDRYSSAAAAPANSDPSAFRLAMRQLASGVCLVTLGEGEGRVGLTATSVASLSVEPPALVVCVSRAASLYPRLFPGAVFGVSVLAADQSEIADRFAGRTGLAGAERFRQERWTTTPGGAPALTDALANFECEVEELIERHSHAIVVARVRLALPKTSGGALVYWRGGFDQIGWSEEQISRAIGVTPAPDVGFAKFASS